MILGKAFPECRSFFNEIGVITALRSIERRFQQTLVAHPMGSAVALDLIHLHGEDFCQLKILSYFASFL